MIEDASLDRAEEALREAYAALLRMANTSGGRLSMPLVYIIPKGRRVEDGWFKQGAWGDRTKETVNRLSNAAEIVRGHDEVFVSGEALARSPRNVVNILFHQLVHQVAGVSSASTYHGPSFAHAAYRLGVALAERHATRGWVEFSYGSALDDALHAVAAKMPNGAFDLYRHPEDESRGSGKMKLWRCQCQKGPSVYTGAILHAVCTRCHQKFAYAHKDGHDAKVYSRVTNGGESIWYDYRNRRLT
jgi:hypothetical protein